MATRQFDLCFVKPEHNLCPKRNPYIHTLVSFDLNRNPTRWGLVSFGFFPERGFCVWVSIFICGILGKFLMKEFFMCAHLYKGLEVNIFYGLGSGFGADTV